MKFTWKTFILLIQAHLLLAAPLSFVPQSLKQPDGSLLHCYASGDEFYHWLHDSLGYTIVQDRETGFFVYAKRSGDLLVPTSSLPGTIDPARLGLSPWLKDAPDLIRKRYEQRSATMLPIKSQLSLRKTGAVTGSLTQGHFNNLVVFIRFSDDPEYTDAVSLYDEIFNDSSAAGVSVRNYFYEVSYQTFRVTSTFYPLSGTSTVVSYQDSLPRAYYEPYSVTNPTGYTSDQEGAREGALVERALNSMKDQVPPGLDVDLNDDGYVDNIVFIVYGSATGWGDLLWPHKTSLSSSRVVFINSARCDEYNLTTQATAKGGSSTFAHEMFHTLGSPDLYHYTDDGNTPVGRWDLMADNKKPPQHMTAYMKYRYGKWIADVPEITQGGTYTLNPLVSATNNCYKLRTPSSPTEYFMLEYRKLIPPFETSLSSEGLLIYRINPSVVGGNRNGPPDAVYVFRPNGTHLVYKSTADATFCFEDGRTAFNSTTNPSCFLTDGTDAKINISNVGSHGDTISFTVTIDSLVAVLQEPATNAQWVVGTTHSIEWLSGGGADTMHVEYSTDAGVSWNTISAASLSPCAWTVPNAPSMSCVLRIRSTTYPGVADSTNFAIAPTFVPLSTMYDATAVTGGSNNSGIVLLANEFWTSRFNSGLLHRWSPSGALLQEFSVDGVTGIRSMTTDDSLVYASAGSTAFYKIDPATRTLVETVTMPMAARNIAFDRQADGGNGGFWIADTTSDLVLLNRQGIEISRITQQTHGLRLMYGLAVDRISPYQSCLWVYTRGTGAGGPQYLVQVRLPEGTPTGFFHDVLQETSSGASSCAAAGLTIGRDSSQGKLCVAGLNQGSPNRVFFYDLAPSSFDPILLATFDVPYQENFDGLGIAATTYLFDNTTLQGVYAYRTIGNAVPNVFSRSSGGSATGGFYSYGNASTSPTGTDRALGGIQSSITSTLYYGIRMRNTSGETIRSLDVTYTGEEWRTGGSSTVTIPNVLAFEYLQAPRLSDVISGSYTPFPALAFTSPTLTPYQTALDGNNAANRTTITASIPVTIPDGEEIMLRWKDVEDASYDHAFAIDDLVVISRRDPVGVIAASAIPLTTALLQNYPNPFNPETVIKYHIPVISNQSSVVSVKVYDVLGREVAVLVNEEKMPGTYTVTWNARLRSSNSGGPASEMASGIYFCTLRAGGQVFTKRMMLLK